MSSIILETRRKEMELSQEEVAKLLGVSRQYYNAIENFKRTPSVTVAKDIGRLLRVDWTIFFSQPVNN